VGSKTFNIYFMYTALCSFWGTRKRSCKCRVFLLWTLTESDTSSISEFWKFFIEFLFVCLVHIHSYVIIWYTTCSFWGMRTRLGIPDCNMTAYMKKTYKKTLPRISRTRWYWKRHSVSIPSKNTLHLYDCFLMPQREHDSVHVKSILKVLLPTRNFLSSFTTFVHLIPYTFTTKFLYNFHDILQFFLVSYYATCKGSALIAVLSNKCLLKVLGKGVVWGPDDALYQAETSRLKFVL
jgi:hypothetical protein